MFDVQVNHTLPVRSFLTEQTLPLQIRVYKKTFYTFVNKYINDDVSVKTYYLKIANCWEIIPLLSVNRTAK